jgi:hypothetical protein
MLNIQSISFIIRIVYLNLPGQTIRVLIFISRWIPLVLLQSTAIELMKIAGPDLAAKWISSLFDNPKTLRKLAQTRTVNQRIKQESNVSPIDPDVKKIILHRTISALESNGVRPFLCFGTLLGLVREHGFMVHDGDLDIGVFYDETSCSGVKEILEKQGFDILHFDQDPWPCRIIARITKLSLNFKIDIVFFKSDGDKLLTFSRIHDHLLIRRRNAFTLEMAKFLDIPVWIPSHPERFLDENYGNWTSKSDFHHYIFKSPLTDLNDPMVRYFLAETILKLTLKGSEDLPFYLNFADKCYPGDSIWTPMNKILVQ